MWYNLFENLWASTSSCDVFCFVLQSDCISVRAFTSILIPCLTTSPFFTAARFAWSGTRPACLGGPKFASLIHIRVLQNVDTSTNKPNFQSKLAMMMKHSRCECRHQLQVLFFLLLFCSCVNLPPILSSCSLLQVMRDFLQNIKSFSLCA